MATIKIKRRHPHKRKKVNYRKKHPVKFLLLVVFVILFTTAGIGYGTIANWTEGLNKVELNATDEELGIDSSIDNNYPDVMNVMIYAVDSQGYLDTQINRSDVNMLVSCNRKKHSIKFIPFLRDTEVNVKNHGSNPLKEAYFYGGPKAALRAINSNFGLAVREYVLVDFESFVEFMDYFGGVDVEINSDDARAINEAMLRIRGANSGDPVSAGKAHLTGEQMLNYMRNGSGNEIDKVRLNRELELVNQSMNKVLDTEKKKWPDLLRKFCNTLETNVEDHTIIEFLRLLYNGDIDAKKYTVSNDSFDLDVYETYDSRGRFVWKMNNKKAGRQIRKIIYDR